MSPSRAKEHLDVTYRTANRAMRILEDNGIVTEVTGRGYGRIFVAEDVLSIVER